jgi:hypothetical protein
MPFASYATIADVARAHRIHLQRAAFVTPVPASLSDYFRSELEFTLSEVSFDGSEYSACETLIYPILREVWKPYREAVTLWSHQPLYYNEDLSGVPDYLVARRSPLGHLVLDAPYLLVVEAKKDDFPRGWGECLAAMLAAQKLSELSEQTFYGISTNGLVWQFGQLQGDTFTQDSRPFSLEDVENLTAAVHFVMLKCRDQAAAQPCAT